jgi:hypothetical protein
MVKANSPHALADLVPKIGKITIAWNDLHLFIFGLFWRLNGNAALRSKAIFFAVRADRTQRDMTAALVQVELSRVPDLRDATIALLKDIGNAARRRNDVIHAMWSFESDWDQGTAHVFEPSSPRLSKKRLGEELDKLYEDLTRLGGRLSTIHRQVIEFYEILDRFQAQPQAHPGQQQSVEASRPECDPADTPLA